MLKPNFISARIYSFLRCIVLKGNIKEEDMNILDQRTLAAVLNRKYVYKVNGTLHLTTEGLLAYEYYANSDIPMRAKSSDLSNLVKQLLSHRDRRKKIISINEKTKSGVSKNISRAKKSVAGS